MSKLVVFLLFSLSLFSGEFKDWDYTHTFTLKKDEVAKIRVIKKEYESQPKPEGDFSFRWTLYHNKLLVLLVNYENHKTQYALQKLYKRDAVTFNLLGDYENFNQQVILKLKFLEFSKDKATLEAMIYDPKKRTEVEFIEPKKKR
jgi:hypothetical protein